MRDVFDQSGQLLPDDLRITPLGSIVRRCSLDEVLQLINVLRGEMSIVGPRPLLMKYLLLYDDAQHRRHDVLPGITGWAQVHGRNNLSWEKKFKLDLEYLTKRSFLLDAKILILTFFIVLTRSGVNKEGCQTTTEFKGSSAF
jgi:undecaprenyl phosphate N,N'-diacetylbacillosamine 1-phosphate transferase